jgi:hypothetical protein
MHTKYSCWIIQVQGFEQDEDMKFLFYINFTKMFLKRKSMKFLLKHKQIILKFNFGKYAQKI